MLFFFFLVLFFVPFLRLCVILYQDTMNGESATLSRWDALNYFCAVSYMVKWMMYLHEPCMVAFALQLW